MQASPISARIDGTSVVIGAGKMGYIYELNGLTGVIWKTAVGQHNGHDNDSLQALEHRLTLKVPYTIAPGSLGGVLTNPALARNSVYAATLDVPLTYTSLNQASPTEAAGLPSGEVEALGLATGKVVFRRQLPTSANSPIAIAGNAVIVPAGGPVTRTGGGDPQVVAYVTP
ncbi:MAG: hypothetical protein ABSG43_18785 [Solirubrobacteraceae bacterium]